MHVTLIVLEDAFATAVAVSVDVLSTAAAMSKRQGGGNGPSWRVVSATGGPVRLSSGLSVDTERLDTDLGEVQSIWVVPGLAVSSASGLTRRLGQADAIAVASAIGQHVASGGRVAASCSAVFLLAHAGVVEDKTATTTWWLAPTLSQLKRAGDASAMACQHVDAAQMVVQDGSVTTAGAALGHTDLMMHLLRQNCGAALAKSVAQLLLIDARGAQSQYVIPAMLFGGDDLMSRLSAHIEASLPVVASVKALARWACMSERTLARHVIAATGAPPTALIQQLRLSRAKALLEGSNLSVDEVSARVGYADATSLRRLLMKATGATPSQMRRTGL